MVNVACSWINFTVLVVYRGTCPWKRSHTRLHPYTHSHTTLSQTTMHTHPTGVLAAWWTLCWLCQSRDTTKRSCQSLPHPSRSVLSSSSSLPSKLRYTLHVQCTLAHPVFWPSLPPVLKTACMYIHVHVHVLSLRVSGITSSFIML